MANKAGLYDRLATCHPTLTRGLVACRTCGKERRVNAAKCLRHGWPECCGCTMTLDVAEVRREQVNHE